MMPKSKWNDIMVYGSDDLVQLANKDRTLVDHDIIGYLYPRKPNINDMLRAFYNNATSYSTSIWRLVSRGTTPWTPKAKPKPLFNDLDVLTPRRLIACKMSDLLVFYGKEYQTTRWWQRNLSRINKRHKAEYLKQVIGDIGRSCHVRMVIEHDAPCGKEELDFMLAFSAMLGYPEDDNFHTSFAFPVYLSMILGKTLKDKAKTLSHVPKHLRKRFAIMNDSEFKLVDCVRVAEAVGCRVALHASNYVDEGGPISLKHKLVERAKNTCRANKGSSPMGFTIFTNERIVKRLKRIIPAYAKHGDVVIQFRK